MKYNNKIFLLLIVCTTLMMACNKNDIRHSNPLIEKNIRVVPERAARIIAENFVAESFFNLSNAQNHTSFKSTIKGNNPIRSSCTLNDPAGFAALYVYNFNEGFLFVSADFQMQPIAGYIEKGEFDKDKIPAGANMWVKKTIDNIALVRKGLYDNSKLAKAAWKDYLVRYLHINKEQADEYNILPVQDILDPGPCETNPNYSNYSNTTVGPLVPYTWGQGCSYNNLLPDKGCSSCNNSGKPLTGCVATAMAQIIAYWQYPYIYNYTSMPANTGDVNVQALMADVGASVSMEYGCTASGPSGTLYFGGTNWFTSQASTKEATAFKGSPFYYASAASTSSNSSYFWSTIQNNIDNHMPVILGGFQDWNSFWNYPEGNGHSWVCDGYSLNTYEYCANGTLNSVGYGYLYMNWGWEGVYNGWFTFDNWAVPNTVYHYNYFREITYNIHP